MLPIIPKDFHRGSSSSFVNVTVNSQPYHRPETSAVYDWRKYDMTLLLNQ